MAIPGEWETLWERRSRGRKDAHDDTKLARSPVARGGFWGGAILLVVIFLYTTVRSLVALFAGGAAVTPLHIAICTSTTVGQHLGSDLLGAFLEREGGRSVHAAVNGPITRMSSRLPGRLFDTTLEMRSDESAFAFDALASGRCNVALIARGIHPGEAARFRKPPSANLIALDGAVLVVNPSNPLHSISSDDVRSIFAGTTRTWARINGAPGRIDTVLPAQESDEFALFVERFLHGRAPGESVQQSEDVAATVASPDHRQALGLTTFHASDPAHILQTRSRAGTDVAASTLTIGRRTYPLVMPIYAYHDEATMTPAAYQFLQFLNSQEAQSIVVADGFVSPFAF